MSEQTNSRPPRDNLFRAVRGLELRAATDDEETDAGGMPTMFGHFAVFNVWTEIRSFWEGNFLERIAKGAFRKTFSEQRDSMRVLFQHGYDYVVGDKPLGPIEELSEDDAGAYYEVPLLDTGYVRELLPGLEAGLYGASFCFRVLREEIVEDPEPSDYNPKGLQERTITEAQVMEFGPVTFPAYQEATAGVRSITDAFMLDRLSREQPGRGRELLDRPAGGAPAARALAVAFTVGETSWTAESPCERPVRAHDTYALRCGDCAGCRAAADPTSRPDAETESHLEPEHRGASTGDGAGTEPHPARSGGAGAELHPAHGSRGTITTTKPLYGAKEDRSWLL